MGTSGHAEQAWRSTDRTRGQIRPVSAHAGRVALAVSRYCRARRRPWAVHGRDRSGMPWLNASPMTCGISFCEDANSVLHCASGCWSRVETRAYPILIGPDRIGNEYLRYIGADTSSFTLSSCGNTVPSGVSADDRLRNTSQGPIPPIPAPCRSASMAARAPFRGRQNRRASWRRAPRSCRGRCPARC